MVICNGTYRAQFMTLSNIFSTGTTSTTEARHVSKLWIADQPTGFHLFHLFLFSFFFHLFPLFFFFYFISIFNPLYTPFSHTSPLFGCATRQNRPLPTYSVAKIENSPTKGKFSTHLEVNTRWAGIVFIYSYFRSSTDCRVFFVFSFHRLFTTSRSVSKGGNQEVAFLTD